MEQGVVTKIAELAKAPFQEEVAGIPYAFLPDPWKAYDMRKKEPHPDTLTIHTLSGLRDYLQANRDALELNECLLHVESHEKVVLLSRIYGEMKQRDRLVEVVWSTLFSDSYFQFGAWHPLEQFNIALQSRFVDDEELRKVLRVTGNVKDSDVRQAEDDGIKQEVTVTRGVHLGSSVDVPNQVTLRPYRTFRDVEQPASKFVLRLKAGQNGQLPTAGLFEADGGAWRQTAMENIGRYLRTTVPDGLAVIV